MAVYARLGVIAAVLASVSPALAQSAADKAMARRLATEGIELHNQGKNAEALDKLQRAQSLYDAPIHLLYIARAHAKLGQLVEASETYRRLVRVELAPNAPAAFRDALQDGKKELAEVEARIGTLRIDVTPENVSGLKLTIDGQEVSSAVVGVERPSNPGTHSVTASAPGHLPAEATVEVGERENRAVALALRPDPNARNTSPGDGPSDSSGGPGAPTSADVRSEAARDGAEEEDEDGLNLVFGLRVGAALPGGTLYAQGESEVVTSDYFKAGVGLELHAGAWFARYFGAKLYVEGASFAPGPLLDRLDEFDGAKVKNQTTSQGVGIAAMVGMPLRRYGAFGEIGVTFVERLAVSRSFESDASSCGSRFEQSLSFTGAAFRVGAGARIPIARVFQLTPFVLATFGSANKVENDSPCEVLNESRLWPASGDLEDSAVHRTIVIGVGGDLTLGIR